MTIRLKQGTLKDVLAEAEHELQEVLARAERLKEFISVTRKLTTRGNVSGSVRINLVPTRRRRSNAIANPVREILREAGRPMHVKEIVAELERRGQRITAQNPLATVAVALKRRPDEFDKVGPNKYALIKQQEASVGA